ncbi:hypothetical protein JHU04_004084 [Brenneria sp. 4F2]|nr:hypothetical protein [Brenneria bubanii]
MLQFSTAAQTARDAGLHRHYRAGYSGLWRCQGGLSRSRSINAPPSAGWIRRE